MAICSSSNVFFYLYIQHRYCSRMMLSFLLLSSRFAWIVQNPLMQFIGSTSSQNGKESKWWFNVQMKIFHKRLLSVSHAALWLTVIWCALRGTFTALHFYNETHLQWSVSLHSFVSLTCENAETIITWCKMSPQNGTNLLTLQHCYSILWQYAQSVNKFDEVGKVFLCHLHTCYCTFSVVTFSWGEKLAFCDAAGFYHQKFARF